MNLNLSELLYDKRFIIPLLIWTTFWKGRALWRSAKNNQLFWFIPFLFINTVGILEIIYLKFFQPDRKPYIYLVKNIQPFINKIKKTKLLK